MNRRKLKAFVFGFRDQEFIGFRSWGLGQIRVEGLGFRVRVWGKEMMEVTRFFRLSTAPQKKDDIFWWNDWNLWTSSKGSMQFQMLICPMTRHFNCTCQLKICLTDLYVSIKMRGTYEADSHASDKDRSKHLSVVQTKATDLMFSIWACCKGQSS